MIELSVTGLEEMAQRIDGMIESLGGSDLEKRLLELANWALVEITARTPRRKNPHKAGPVKLADGWRLEVERTPDGVEFVVRHDLSDPEHPDHVILASLEYGARGKAGHSPGKPIRPHSPKTWLAWQDESGAWQYRREVTNHPGNLPYGMVAHTAESVSQRIVDIAIDFTNRVARRR